MIYEDIVKDRDYTHHFQCLDRLGFYLIRAVLFKHHLFFCTRNGVSMRILERSSGFCFSMVGLFSAVIFDCYVEKQRGAPGVQVRVNG